MLAAALSLTLELEVEEASEFAVEAPGIDVPTDRSNLCVKAFESLHSADGVRFRIRSDIPLARGLGSSAAAIVAGLVAAEHLYELALSKEELLERAAKIEGHPDNVAAALYGGFVACVRGGPAGEGGPVAARFEPTEGIEAVLLIPAEEVPTEQAREAIPDQVPLADAVANIGSTALLVLGLQRGDLNLIQLGLRDRIHQPRRSSLYPKSVELIESASELGAIGASISGAGPTVLFWVNWQETGQVVEALKQRVGAGAEIRRVPFAALGADVPEL